MELFFDTETSGTISKKLSFDDRNQAWCCQLAAILSTKDEIISELNVLIKSNGRTIPQFITDIHGITTDMCDTDGVEEHEALEGFAVMLKDCPKRICHNYDFDSVFLYHMFQRNISKLSDEGRSAYFLQHPYFCTMKDQTIKKYINAKNVKGRLKWAKLAEMYKKLLEEDMPNAHDAMGDVIALRRCYYELQKREIIA